ncbi:MAG: DUF1292 domain-containing protein [Bacillota bacterium]
MHEDSHIVLVDDAGQEHEFELVRVLALGDRNYAILYPLDEELDNEEEGEYVVFRIEKGEDDEDVLVLVDDEEELEEVSNEWERLFDEEDNYDYDDDDEEDDKD